MGAAYRAGERLVARLEAAGLRVTMNPRSVNPPCVVIGPPVLTLSTLDGTWSADWELILCGTGAWSAETWNTLDDLLDKLTDAVTVTELSPNIFDTGDRRLPCYKATLTEGI